METGEELVVDGWGMGVLEIGHNDEEVQQQSQFTLQKATRNKNHIKLFE